ncbi:MAG: glycosyltransferase, partial [Proteobacteria bacterium]|nr:glycosyltransferase [Pseudomonadota bacterium]
MQFEPAVPASQVADRTDFLIRGRVVSHAPLDTVALLRDGRAVCEMGIGRAQPGRVLRFADGTEAVQHSFTFHLPLTQDPPPDTNLPLQLRVRTRDRAESTTGFALRLSGGTTPSAAIVGGPAVAGVWRAGGRPPIVAYAERAQFPADGALEVTGWTVADDPVVAVHAFDGNRRVGSALIGGLRPDVAAAYPDYPNARNAGFALSLPTNALKPTAATLRLKAVSRSGAFYDLLVPLQGRRAAAKRAMSPPPAMPDQAAEADKAAPDSAQSITLHSDEMALGTDGSVLVRGWALCPFGIAEVAILLDDRPIGTAVLGQMRLDVAAAYPAIPDARFSGFELIARPLAQAGGTHRLTVEARNNQGGTRSFSAIVAAEAPRSVPHSAPPRPAPDTSGQDVPAPDGGANAQAFRFHIDNPPVRGGVVPRPVTSRLSIEGWALARDGVAEVEIMLDGRRLGTAQCGLARHDVGSAFPDWPDAARSGFAFHCPARSMSDGRHVIVVRVVGTNGAVAEERFGLTVAKQAESAGQDIRRRIPTVEADLYGDTLRRLGCAPHFRLLLHPPASKDRQALATGLDTTFGSLSAQAYPHWSVRVLGDSAALREAVIAAAARAGVDRTRLGFLPPGGNADGAHADHAPEPIAEAGEESGGPVFVGALGTGDELGADALAEIAVEHALHPGAALLYADEIRPPEPGAPSEPFFKPGFSPDLLLSTNYIGRPWFARADVLEPAGVTAASVARDGDYDALLRATEHAPAAAVRAVPRLLCRRGALVEDAAKWDGAALAAAAERRGIVAEIEPGCQVANFRLRRRVTTRAAVSVIIPTRAARSLIRTCIDTLRARTANPRIEIIAIDNIPDDQPEEKAWLAANADRIVRIDAPFNWSRFNNHAAAEASGEFLLFLNDDIEVLQDGWLDAMLEHAERPEVGVVGARLLYPTGRVQHAGMFLAGNGLARHAFRYATADDPGYFGLARTQRNVIAVTGACMLVRHATFDMLRGFDEAHEVINNDLDFCLRAHEAGFLTVFTPHATLIHHELASRGDIGDIYDPDRFGKRWRLRFAEGDPFHNQNLSRRADDFRPDDEAVREIASGHPLFRASDIRRILVVKADHIGDFVTALPAMRRLRAHFPDARISVLANRVVCDFVALDPAIDEIIEFDFFYARSALGRRDLTAGEMETLRDRLAPYHFDLAIDLRKHLDTRELLRASGAEITAGFDQIGQFPWLDVALEWEGDRGLHGKRLHVADDLLRLVDAVATAARADRTGIVPEAVAALQYSAVLPDGVADFLSEPAVCVHPGAGNEMKQWPETYFAALIDLLVKRHG